MGTVQKSLRIQKDIARAIQESAESSGKDFSSVTNELLAEAVKLRACPGILFADGPSGRRARIAGTGIDVWEVIEAYRGLGRKWARLRTTASKVGWIGLIQGQPSGVEPGSGQPPRFAVARIWRGRPSGQRVVARRSLLEAPLRWPCVRREVFREPEIASRCQGPRMRRQVSPGTHTRS